MVQMSNRIFSLLFIFVWSVTFSQNEEMLQNTKDYKEPKQFEKYSKRSSFVSAWQINKLKDGALVVRLKTNKKLIDELVRQGNTKLALEKELEQYAINKNTVYAYKDVFNFCKVYFMYSNSSDSLLNGIRSHIFLDSTLTINPSIVMNESYYLIAERDYGYNSSIGFVKEDSARVVVEHGNPVRQMAIVLKNKYGHQLKAPFPYLIKEKNFMDIPFDFPISTRPSADGKGVLIDFEVNKTFLQDRKENKNQAVKTAQTVKIKKQYTYEKISEDVGQLNDNLLEFFRASPQTDERKLNPIIKPYLY